MSDEKVYCCTGCGRVCTDPAWDLKQLKEFGCLACCPERDMQPHPLHAQLAAKDAENKRLREALRQVRHTMTQWLEPQIARIADAITIIDAALKEDTNG